MVKILSCFFFIIYSSICLSGTIDPNTPDEKYLNYGSKFPYIGLLVGKKNDDSSYSGSVVAHKKNIIITAAHLFENNKIAGVIFNNKLLPILKIMVHNDYDYGKFGSHDIAVCLVSGDIGLDWYPEIYSNKDEKGKICSMSGFGATGTFISGAVSGGGGRRAGSNFIDSVDKYMIFCSPSVLKGRTELEFLIAPGDSGGGLFIGNELAGIHSGVIEDKANAGKSKYGAVSGHTRVSVYLQWIQESILKLEKE